MQTLEERIRPFIGDEKLVGAVVLIAQQGQIKHHRAYGFLERETHTSMPQDGIFRIYSMTKPITSVAMMMLVEQGKVALNDPIAHYLPAFSRLEVLGENGRYPSPTLPTIADILRHTAGFDYRIWETAVAALYREHGVWDVEKTLAETIDILAALPLSYEPGTSWQYSVSPDVTARIVEIVSGEPFDQYLQDALFTPLGMIDTGFYVPKPKIGRFTTLYGSADWASKEMTGRQLGEAAQHGKHDLIATAAQSLEAKPHQVIRGGTGLVTTAMDYFRFCQMLLNGGELDSRRLLKPETVTAMVQNQLPPASHHHFSVTLNQPGQGFGFGFKVLLEKPAWGNKGEYSWWGAANSSFWVDPAKKIVGVQMSQYMPPGIFPLGEAVKTAVYEK